MIIFVSKQNLNLKKITALILLITFTAILFERSLIFISYQYNKEYIVKNFCINKDKPELKCDGKCHLKKLLKKSSDKANNEKFPYNELNIRWLDFISGNTISIQNISYKIQINNGIWFNQFSNSEYIQKIFHPPSKA